ncbi:hypothetical protein Tco_0580978 [Tanacetum coccineum]
MEAQSFQAKLFNEWEKFKSTEGESIESYYHRFSKVMNDFFREKHFPEKIASNLKFLNNLQPEWNRSVTTVHQTKDLYQVDYTELYDFLKFNQAKVNEIRAERLAKAHDPLALMAHSQTLYNYPVFHQDHPSHITYMQHLPPNNNYNPQPSFNQNYMQQPMPNPEDILDPTTAINMTLVLMAKAFKLNYSTPTNNNQRISSNPRNRQIAQPSMNMGQDRQIQMIGGHVQNLRVQNVGNQNGLIVVPGIAPLIAHQNANYNGNGNVVAARAEGNVNRNNGIQLQAKEFDLMVAVGDIDVIEDVNANYVLMANLQQASTSATEVERVNMVNRKMRETNADFTTEKCFEINQEKYDTLESGYQKVLFEKHDPSVVYDSNGSSSIGVDNTSKTRRPQPRSNTKNDRVPSASKSNGLKNKEAKVEEHHRNLLLSNNKRPIWYPSYFE